MIPKDDLTAAIQEMSLTKEHLCAFLRKRLSVSLDFSGLSAGDQTRIKSCLSEMIERQNRHIAFLQEIREDVAEGGPDVY